MATRTLLAAALLTLTVGCFDSDADGPAPVVECHEDGTCWALADGWDAWAQVWPDGLMGSDALEAADVVGDSDCWRVSGSDARLCSLEVEGVETLARPVVELDLMDADCDMSGPWDQAAALGSCWGVVGPLAFQLR